MIIMNGHMKKRLLLLLAVAAMVVTSARADFFVAGEYYHVDTIVHRQVGPGIFNTIIRLPDWSMTAYVLSVDLNNPNNRVETTTAYNTLGKTELLTNALQRNRTATVRPIGACNANFWVTSASTPWSYFMNGTPMGGVVRNDTTVVNDNNTVDQWNGGPLRTGVASITHDKTLVFGRMLWEGLITGDKLAQPVAYHNVNRRAVTGEICLWNPRYTRTRQFEDDWVGFSTRGNNHTDNYYLTLAEGEGWKNNSPMTFVVAKIVNDADRQTLGNYDACLTVTGDANKAAMAALEVGDVIQVTSGWRSLEQNPLIEYPNIENLVTGNATVMIDGQLTERNYDETYNSEIYSRTIYGASGDGKHLYLMVIDRSMSPLYGMSWGCATSSACEVMQQMCPDVKTIVNMDAGGSAEMIVMGKVINTTTEGNARGVACGWMVEAVGEEDNEIASIAFEPFRIEIPELASTTPRILGYNRIGELIDEDVKGFELSCDESLGSASDSVFTAGSAGATGTLKATLGDMTAEVNVTVVPGEPAIVLKPVLIDTREYPIEVTSSIVFNKFFYNPSMIEWTLADPTVASVTDGRLRGESNGSTALGCSFGNYGDNTTVTVEIADEPYLYQTWDGWTFKGAGAKDIAIDEATGDITFTYSSNRAPYLQMSKDLTLYSLPDTVGIVFNSTMPIDYVQIDARNRFATTSNFLKISPPNGASTFEAGKDYTILLNLEALGGVDYVGTYPVTIKVIKFTLNKNGTAGAHTLAMKSFYCHYPNVNASQTLTGDVNGDGEVNIADINAIINIILTGTGVSTPADVNEDGEINVADVNAVINIVLGS